MEMGASWYNSTAGLVQRSFIGNKFNTAVLGIWPDQ